MQANPVACVLAIDVDEFRSPLPLRDAGATLRCTPCPSARPRTTGGVLTAHGTICRLQRFCGSYHPEQDQSGLDSGLLLDSRQAGTDRYRTILTLQEPIRFTRIAIDCTTGYFGLG